MPPRLQIALPIRHRRPRVQLPSITLLSAPTTTANAHPTPSQSRDVHILATLSDNRGAYHPEKRRGRGPASGLGKTSGRGHKGQKQHGKVPAGFEGGQTPLRIVHGERGYVNVHSQDITVVPLSRIQSWVAQGRIDPTRPITPLQLITSRCVHGLSDGIKLLASSRNHLYSTDVIPTPAQPLNIVVSEASAAAIAAVEAAGGSVTTRYYTRFALDKIVRGEMHPTVSLRTDPEVARAAPGVLVNEAEAPAPSDAPAAPSGQVLGAESKPRIRTGYKYRLPDPAHRKDIEYYRDPTKRGYLAYEVPEGEGPSLFFKTLAQRQREQKERAVQRRARGDVGERRVLQKRAVRPGEKSSLW